MYTIETLIARSTEISDARRKSLVRAIELGADDATLETLADALRVKQGTTVVLPRHHYEGLSRGKGWCRLGQGDSVTWGERVDDGYKVGPGRWTVGASDGFKRKAQDVWVVKHVTVGAETWTIAS